MRQLVEWQQQGQSLDRIYFRLLSTKIKTRRGREWSRTRIHRAIQAELALRKMSPAELDSLCPKPNRRPKRRVSRKVERGIIRFAGFVSRSGTTDGQIIQAFQRAVEKTGGGNRFARVFWTVFDECKPRSSARLKMLSGLLATMCAVDEQAARLEEAEREQALQRRVAELWGPCRSDNEPS